MAIPIGTHVEIAPGAEPRQADVTFDSVSKKFVVVYSDDNASDDLYAVVGTVSGNTISFGTPTFFDAPVGSSPHPRVVVDNVSGKVVAVTAYGKAFVGTISGNSISFGSASVFDAAAAGFCYPRICCTNSGIAIGYLKENDLKKPYVVAGTVSGSTVVFGTAVALDTAAAGSSDSVPLAYDPINEVILAVWQNGSTPRDGKAAAFSVSGTTITAGTKQTICSDGNMPSVFFHPGVQKFVALYELPAAHSAFIISVSGLTLTVDGSGSTSGFISVYDPAVVHNPDTGISYLFSENYSSADELELRPLVVTTGVTYGEATQVVDGFGFYPRIAYDSANNTVVVFFFIGTGTYKAYAAVALPAAFWTKLRGLTEI